jgi:hypothetical protein
MTNVKNVRTVDINKSLLMNYFVSISNFAIYTMYSLFMHNNNNSNGNNNNKIINIIIIRRIIKRIRI